MPSHIALVLTFMIMSQLSSSISMKNRGLFRPALNRPTLIEPKASTVAATAAALSSRLVTSILTATALPFPAALIRSATLRFVEIEIAEADIGALGGEGLGIGRAHAAGGAGDQDVLSFQAIGVHEFLPLNFVPRAVKCVGPALGIAQGLSRALKPAQHVVEFLAADLG
jgi:hypothetical protein